MTTFRLNDFTLPIICLSCLTVLFFDRLSKIWARTNLKLGFPSPPIFGIFRFDLTTNTGGAFGLGKDNAQLMTGLAVLIVATILIVVIRRNKQRLPKNVIEMLG